MSPIVCPGKSAEFEPQNAPGRASAIAEGEVVIVRIIISVTKSAQCTHSAVDNT